MQDTGNGAQLGNEIEGLRREIEKLNRHRFVRLHNNFGQLMWFNFSRGLAFGLGTVIGASVLLSFVAWTLATIEFLPIIGDWAAQIARQIEDELSK